MRCFPTALLALTLSSLLSAACQPAEGGTGAPERPDLVVGIIVDQMRPDFVHRYWDHYGEGGFKRLVHEGFSFRNAHFRHLQTSTGPGHAAQLTGATPAVHGLLGNSWYVPELGRNVNVIEDVGSGHQGVGSESGYDGEKSPANMITTTVGDELHLHTAERSRTIGISRKDRGAILPAGHTGQAYWYESATGNFVTSTYYREELPGWLQEFNDRDLAQEYLARTWEPARPLEEYVESRSDDNPYEGTLRGMDGPTFPIDLPYLVEEHGHTPGILSVTPFGDELLLELAKAAMEGEELGRREVPDILTVAFSGPDAVGHTWGPGSKQVQDHYVRLDGYLERLLDHLEEELGRENVLVFLTSDHGAGYIPHYQEDLGIPTGHPEIGVSAQGAVTEAVRDYMEERYGGDFLLASSNHNLYLDHDFLEAEGLRLEEVRSDLKRFALTLDPVAGALTADALQRGRFTRGIPAMAQESFHQKRSGDVVIWLKPHTHGTGTGGASHGTPWVHDSHAPLHFYGFDVPAGESLQRVHVSDIASTVATFLGSPFPSGNIGDPLNDLMRE